MTKGIRVLAATMISVIGLGLVAPSAAEAGSKGRRNTAIALGAVALYGIVKKKPVVAGVAGAGALYSYISSRRARSQERDRDRRRRYRRAYNGYGGYGGYGGGYSPYYAQDYGRRRGYYSDYGGGRYYSRGDDDYGYGSYGRGGKHKKHWKKHKKHKKHWKHH